jgi:glycerate kinase
MRVVIAPDKFKGSLEAPEVAEAIADGLAAALPTADVHCQPVADGGEGTVAAAIASGYEAVTVSVTGPVGEPVDATFAVDSGRAVIEMAAASGLLVLPRNRRGEPIKDALGATSVGTGELITAALDRGCTEIVLGVGGSANTDGGSGLLTGLGARLVDAEGQPVPLGGGGLAGLDSVDLSGLDPRARTGGAGGGRRAGRWGGRRRRLCGTGRAGRRTPTRRRGRAGTRRPRGPAGRSRPGDHR